VAEGARRRLAVVGRGLATLAAAAVIVWRVDLRAVASRLGQLDGRWIAAFLALSLPLYLLYAWRWWFTAARVGAPLDFRRALYDYYVSTLLNQVLPIGIAGDVVRALRHRGRLRGASPAEDAGSIAPAATAVVLERLSGFAGLALFVAAAAVAWLVRGRRELVPVGAGALAALGVGLFVVARAARRGDLRIARLAAAGHAALIARGALAFQLAISTAAVALLVALFTCAARAAGAPLSLPLALAIVPLVLAATTVPWAFGGWGAREATVAALYRLVGLDAATGVAVSVTFGLLSLAAAAPGLIVLALPNPPPADPAAERVAEAGRR
jgi:uncharacterized membrane protein YbhN (UPF0104 family)